MGPPPERRSTISNMMPSQTHAFPSVNNTRMRNLSGGSSGSTSSSTGSSSTSSSLNMMDTQYSSDNQMLMDNSSMSQQQHHHRLPGSSASSSSSLSHRKLDRSLSDSDSDRLSGNTSSSAQSQRSVNSSRYKTELCRPFEESGSCKYGDKCQFAHGYHELRNLSRHPKYKTELCRTFHTIGFCPYGPRCHFLHEAETAESSPKPARQASTRASNNYNTPTSGSTSPSLSPSGSDTDYNAFTYHSDGSSSRLADDSVNKNTISSSNMQSMEQQFNSVLNFNTRNPTNDNGNVFGGIFNSGSKKVPKPIGSDEYDIFSEVTMFNPASVVNTVDNAPKQALSQSHSSTSSSQSYSHSSFNNMQSMKLDNFQSYHVDTSCWQPQNSHHSPTGSMGSDGCNSECSGSTESLASSGCCRDTTGSFSPFSSHWISGF